MLGLLLVGACADPVRVRRADPQSVLRELTRSVLTSSAVSGPTHNVLHRYGLVDAFARHPEQVLADLHRQATESDGDPDLVFALAELSFAHAERTGQRSHHIASALYAFAFLFPERTDLVPHRFDPRVRIAADLYNRGLTRGLATDDGREVAVAGGVHALPFGELRVEFDPATLRWGDRRLVHFVPAAEVQVHGLRERYRRTGLGVPLAAGTAPLEDGHEPDEFVAQETRVPVTAILHVPTPRGQLAAGEVRATLTLHDALVTERVRVATRDVPLEVEPTAALAYMLSEQRFWDVELKGLFGSAIVGDDPMRLMAVQPYRRGRIPVVFVHGTASSPGRWADMVNDLLNDPRVRERFQIWYFTYDTGNPILYTADGLRESLRQAVARLDPEGSDPALRQMVVIGHSQGGLLTKSTVIDSGDRLYVWGTPVDRLRVSEKTRAYIRRVAFLEPLPFVRRVVFIATPHQGSYVAGNWLAHQTARFIRLPGRLLEVGAEVVKGNPELATERITTAIDDMTPRNPLVKALADIPVAPEVASHSIVAVQGNGPVEDGDDGVVEYRSAHRTDVDSEVVVRAAHSCQSEPQTIAEVRRILLLHLEEESERSFQ
jgi:pimeloyl-ACP methyl ester carboxylesterase